MTQATEKPSPSAPSAFDEATKLRADNEELRRKLTEAEARKTFPPPKSTADPSAPPRWFRCHLQQLPMNMAIHVSARSEDEAKRVYCERMGVIWDKANNEPMTSDRLAVEQVSRPLAKLMRGKYTRTELLALKFEERELDEAAI